MNQVGGTACEKQMEACGAGHVQGPKKFHAAKAGSSCSEVEGNEFELRVGGTLKKALNGKSPRLNQLHVKLELKVMLQMTLSVYKSNIFNIQGRKGTTGHKSKFNISQPRNKLRHSGRPLAPELEAHRGRQVSHSWGHTGQKLLA